MTTTELQTELAKTKELFAAAGRVNKGLVEQIGKLKADLQKSLLKSYNYELEIARLKHRVNTLIRKNQSRRSKP